MRFRVGLGYGILIYTLFSIVDVYAAMNAPGSRLWILLALRWSTVLCAALPLYFRLRRLPTLPPVRFRVYDLFLYSYVVVTVTLMAIELGGINNLYLCGITTVIIARGVAQPEHWRRGVVSLCVPLAAHLVVMLVASLTLPWLAAQWRDAGAVSAYVLMNAFTYIATLFLLFSGHSTWALRQQLFEARRLGRYRLTAPLGEGGMGTVWAASHPSMRQKVAVKVLRPERSRDPIVAAARFEREVRATAELSHPNTVRVFDYGVTDDGLAYYAMELLDGKNLRAVVDAEGALVPQRAVRVTEQVASSLIEAHARGIVHRDIKPENIILCQVDGAADFVKVIDFGIAHLKSDDITLTRTGMIIGTPGFIAPEVQMGASADERADVYALGCVLHFLLTGCAPSSAQTAEVPDTLRVVIEQALLPHDARTASMAAFARALTTAV